MTNKIDSPLVPIVNMMNELPGIKTTASCSGHGYDNCYISFECTNFKSLKKIIDAVYDLRWDCDNDFDSLVHLWIVDIDPFRHPKNTICASIRWQEDISKRTLRKIRTVSAFRVLKESMCSHFRKENDNVH